MGTAIKHPVPDRVKLSWASECPDVKNYKWRLNPVWHRMYSCIHMATVGFKGLISAQKLPVRMYVFLFSLDLSAHCHCLVYILLH